MMFAIGEPLAISEKKSLGLNPDGFATRIVKLGKKGTLLLTPLKKGDIVTAVNNVDESVLSRTAIDHVRLKHEPGETITLDVLRNGKKIRVAIRLKPDNYFSILVRFAHFFERLSFRIGRKAKSEY
jgi:S1-C subfamily serine protease